MNETLSLQYMLAGYGVIFAVMGAYLASLFIRRRNLKQDLETLDEVERKKRPS